MAHQTNTSQALGQFPELTLVQWAFPNLFPGAGDIIPLLDKASLPLLGGERKWLLDPLLLFPFELSDDIGGISGLEPSMCKAKSFTDEVELGREHILLLDELAKGIVVLMVA